MYGSSKSTLVYMAMNISRQVYLGSTSIHTHKADEKQSYNTPLDTAYALYCRTSWYVLVLYCVRSEAPGPIYLALIANTQLWLQERGPQLTNWTPSQIQSCECPSVRLEAQSKPHQLGATKWWSKCYWIMVPRIDAMAMYLRMQILAESCQNSVSRM